MKRSILVYMLALLLPCSTFAHDFIVDGICYNITSETDFTCEVTFNSDEKPENVYVKFYKGIVNVPEKVSYNGKEYTVTAIGEKAFRHNDELQSVVMPSTIVSIGHDAFACCPNFKSLTIPENVKEFSNFSFHAMPSLEYLAVDEKNEYFDSRGGCNAIIKTKTNTLYVGCRSTVIPEDIKAIANGAFVSGSGIPGHVTPFEITIPKNVETLESQAFAGCTSLKAITLSEGVKSIGGSAFNGTSIERIVIPASVTEISERAFRGCNLLKEIKVKKGNKVYDSRKGCNAIIESETDKLIVGCAKTYIPKGVKSIGCDAYTGCLIENVDIPSSVELIEEYAFANCRNLKHIVIPGNVKEIESSAFWASGIESVTVEEGVEKIGIEAFSHCRELKQATLPSSLKEIGESGYGGIFSGCRKLEKVRLDNDNYTYYCNGSVLIEKKSRTVIDGWGIDHCYTGNGYVSLKAKRIGRNAFRGHELLASVALPETLEEIEANAFENCKALRVIECNAVVPPTVGKDAFKLNLPRNGYVLPLQERTVLVVPKGSLEAYRNAPGWKEFKHIKEEVTLEN